MSTGEKVDETDTIIGLVDYEFTENFDSQLKKYWEERYGEKRINAKEAIETIIDFSKIYRDGKIIIQESITGNEMYLKIREVPYSRFL